MIDIDGSIGEGGGQVLRSSLTLSLLLQKPFRISNIRARRSNPGLQAQHLTAVRAAKAVGNAVVEGDVLGSKELSFEPKGVQPGDYRFEIGTAGSCSLVLQTVFLPLAHASDSSKVFIVGGTHVPWSPTFEYIDRVWLPTLRRIGYVAEFYLRRPGFFPRGGGQIEALIRPAIKLTSLNLDEREPPSAVSGISLSSNLPAHVARRQRDQLYDRLAPLGIEMIIEIDRPPAIGKGSAVFISPAEAASFYGFSSLGARGKSAERVADEAADQMFSFIETNAVIDQFLADQLLIPLSICTRPSNFSVEAVTHHFTTNATIVASFTDVEITVHEPGADGSVWVVINPENS